MDQELPCPAFPQLSSLDQKKKKKKHKANKNQSQNIIASAVWALKRKVLTIYLKYFLSCMPDRFKLFQCNQLSFDLLCV